jgi:hypothetical protein
MLFLSVLEKDQKAVTEKNIDTCEVRVSLANVGERVLGELVELIHEVGE